METISLLERHYMGTQIDVWRCDDTIINFGIDGKKSVLFEIVGDIVKAKNIIFAAKGHYAKKDIDISGCRPELPRMAYLLEVLNIPIT